MGLGKRSPLTSPLEDSGNIADYGNKYLDLTKLQEWWWDSERDLPSHHHWKILVRNSIIIHNKSTDPGMMIGLGKRKNYKPNPEYSDLYV